MCSLTQVTTKKLTVMIEFIVLIAIIIIALAVACVIMIYDIVVLRRSLRRMNELYRIESDKNIQRIAEEVFRDDMEILNRLV